MQTILGANGTIARELSVNLSSYTEKIRQVSRNPKRIHATDELVKADLLRPDEVRAAVAGTEITYLTAGINYNLKDWQEQWPRIMRNVIDACKATGSKLVFFDNVYAYGRVKGPMREDAPYSPCSKKGEIRARIATTLMDEAKTGNLQAMIVRSADFYGPEVLLSMLHATVVERLRKGKTPQWIGNAKAIHTFTYTPDAGRSVAVLGNTPSAYNQTWHAITSKEKLTGEQLVRLACDAVQRPYGIQPIPKWGIRALGLFVPVLREIVEMMYQFEEDYIFDSTKIEQAFGLKATPYKDGINRMMGIK